MKTILWVTLAIFLVLAPQRSEGRVQDEGRATSSSQTPVETAHILRILEGKSAIVDQVLLARHQYKLQILYTQIDRDTHNRPHFTGFRLGLNDRDYFYPASTVKLPTAILALEKIKGLKIDGLDKNTTMLTDAQFAWQTPAHLDASAASGMPSIGHYIKKLLLVSDNDAYNRLYEFVGQQALNERIRSLGLEQTRIIHRLGVLLDREENQISNPIRFYQQQNLVYQQRALKSDKRYSRSGTNFLGRGYVVDNRRVDGAMDFSHKNAMSIEDMQSILQRLLFPNTFAHDERFMLEREDYTFFYRYMSMLPRESTTPLYDAKRFPDNFSKFFIYGDNKTALSDNIRLFNKVGNAYGFVTDNAYIADLDKRIEFFLTASIYVNQNQIFNDDVYQYDEVGFPFLAELGRIFYQHELKRKRKIRPKLDKFVFDYTAP